MQGSVRRLAHYPLGVVWSGHVRAALFGPSRHLLFPSARTLFSETGVWEKVYQTETRRKVEEWWHPRIMARRRESVEEVRGLSLFTRISGLHQGWNLRAQMMKTRIPEQKFLTVSTCPLSQGVKQLEKQGLFVVLFWTVNGVFIFLVRATIS